MSIPSTNKPKRGVSLYSYSSEYGVTMSLEDMLSEMNDMGATGLEILANSHIENYPNPSEQWLDHWDQLISKYNIVPAEYGHWVDSRLYQGRELNVQESLEMLIRDFKLANRLGFRILRTKLGVIDGDLSPVENWAEIIEAALPYAEQYDVVMCPEIHAPTLLKSTIVQEYVDFIKRTGTKHFGLNIDFGVFETQALPADQWGPDDFVMPSSEHSPVEDIIPILPYVYCCHAKFVKVTDDLQEVTIPYEQIINTLVEHQWNGYMLSEYEGPSKHVLGYARHQVRLHHAMMKQILGE